MVFNSLGVDIHTNKQTRIPTSRTKAISRIRQAPGLITILHLLSWEKSNVQLVSNVILILHLIFYQIASYTIANISYTIYTFVTLQVILLS